MKKYIAEMFGTFALALVVGLSLVIKFPVSTPILAGLVLMLFVYSIGGISGAHINPAVTIGAWSIKKIGAKDALLYIIFQFIGAAIALFVISSSVGMPMFSSVSNNWVTAFAEFLGMVFFTFGIASVLYGKAPNNVSGLVVGGSLLLGITVAALLGSNAVLNPAVAFGIGSCNLVYIFAPIVGSIIGMQAYKYLAE